MSNDRPDPCTHFGAILRSVFPADATLHTYQNERHGWVVVSWTEGVRRRLKVQISGDAIADYFDAPAAAREPRDARLRALAEEERDRLLAGDGTVENNHLTRTLQITTESIH
jgi:hypothetical protein